MYLCYRLWKTGYKYEEFKPERIQQLLAEEKEVVVHEVCLLGHYMTPSRYSVKLISLYSLIISGRFHISLRNKTPKNQVLMFLISRILM